MKCKGAQKCPAALRKEALFAGLGVAYVQIIELAVPYTALSGSIGLFHTPGMLKGVA